MKQKIKSRLLTLYEALAYSSQEREMLTSGDRILINQERARLLHAIEYPRTELRPVPEHVELKIIEITRLIAVKDWKPLNTDPLYDTE